MSSHITAKPWSVIADPNDIRVTHTTRGLLSLSDAMVTMPLWAPAIIREAAEQIEKLREAARVAPAVGIQPMETAPRDGSRVDIWVKTRVSPSPHRITDAAYNTYHRELSDGPQEAGWSSHANGRTHAVFLDKHGEVVGWTPVPEWKDV